MEKTKILFIAASPVDRKHLMLDEEIRTIKERLNEASVSKDLELAETWAARPGDWLKELNARNFRIVHFSGHGTEGGTLQHVGRDGKAQSVTLQALKTTFQAVKADISLVILHACYSRKQAEIIAEEVDCVIAMNGVIHDEAAITFIDEFYRALFSGKSVLDAFKQGKALLLLEGLAGDQVPELLVQRPEVDAGKVLLLETAHRSKAFIGFSANERHYLEELHKHLDPYVQKGTIDYWDSTKMLPGARRHEETAQAIAATRVAILLVSADFFNSAQIIQHELPFLLAAADKGETKILCVLLSACDLEDSDLAPFKLVNEQQTVNEMGLAKRKTLWNNVARQVRDILQGG